MSRNSNVWLGGALALALGLGVVSDATANTVRYYSGQSCAARDPADTGWWYDSTGFRNNTSSCDSERYAWCPVGGWNNSSVDLDGATLYYSDGSDLYSIACTLFVSNNTGGVYSSSARYSCGASTTTGCTSGAYGSTEADYTGYGSLAWSTTSLPNSGSSVSNVGPYAFFCSLPSRSNWHDLGGCYAEDYSRILSFSVDQVNP